VNPGWLAGMDGSRVRLPRWLIGTLALLINLPAGVGADAGSDGVELGLVSFGQLEHQAVVVGVNAYEDRYIERLGYAVSDARGIEAALLELGYEVTFVADEMATRDRILEAVQTAARRLALAPPDRRGNLVFAFSGHGFRLDDDNFLGTVNTDTFDLAATALPISALERTVAQLDVARAVLFIDACRNDPAKSIGLPDRRFAFDERAEGVAILYSTAPEALSYEDDTLKAGVFSHYLNAALRGAAADAAGIVSFDRLESYVIENVVRHSTERYGRVQRPYIAGERSGRFSLGHVEPGARTDSANRSSSSGWSWKHTGVVIGLLALGALVAGASDDDGQGVEESVTLVIPTP